MLLRRAAPALAALVLLSACSAQAEPAPDAAPSSPAAAPLAQPSPAGERVTVTVGDAGPVSAEVADSEQERAVGLMRRTSVPPGTGMVFLYDAPSTGRFYMYDVPVPLTAVFSSGGRVVGVVQMAPCPEGTQPQDCPTYGPDTSYDTVLETAPGTVAGVQVGDALAVRR